MGTVSPEAGRALGAVFPRGDPGGLSSPDGAVWETAEDTRVDGRDAELVQVRVGRALA